MRKIKNTTKNSLILNELFIWVFDELSFFMCWLNITTMQLLYQFSNVLNETSQDMLSEV